VSDEAADEDEPEETVEKRESEEHQEQVKEAATALLQQFVAQMQGGIS